MTNTPKPKLKLRRTIDWHTKRLKASKKPKILTRLVQKISEGKTNRNQLTREVAKEMNMPNTSEIREVLAQNKDYIERTANDILALMAKNALAIMKSFDPSTIQNSYKPLTAAILTDKLLKLREELGSQAIITPQEQLLKFTQDNNITFQQLKHIIETNKLPDTLPPELFRQLQSILKNLPSKTIDLKDNP